jgi:alpha-1,3-rhamnosyl/mannosyltransferase
MDVILDMEFVRLPVTGVGRYALEVLKGLERHPRIGAIHCFVGLGLRDAASVLAGEAPGDGEREQAERGAKVRRLVRGIPGAYRLRAAAGRCFFARAVRNLEGCVYHEPNYVLKPYAGPSVVTVFDLSHLRYPDCHPAERVRHLDRHLARSLARADRVLTISAFSKREIVENYHVPERKVAAIPLGVDEGFHPRPEEALRRLEEAYGLRPGGYLLTVATLEPRKNLPGLVAAHGRLPADLQKRYPLVLVGPTGWKSAELDRRMEATGVPGRVRRLGYVPWEDLKLLYAGARAFAYASFYEGFGLPPLEAMASGVPVLVSTAEALAEVTGDAAWQADPHDVEAMARGLERVLTDEAWRAQAVERGLERARRFTWASCVEGTVRVYEEVLRERGVGA